MARDILAAANDLIYADKARLQMIAERDPDWVRDVAAALIARKGTDHIASTQGDGGAASQPMRYGLAQTLCEDCPPVGYPTEITRCVVCPRRGMSEEEALIAADLREAHLRWCHTNKFNTATGYLLLRAATLIEKLITPTPSASASEGDVGLNFSANFIDGYTEDEPDEFQRHWAKVRAAALMRTTQPATKAEG